jgi:hypothetical protein
MALALTWASATPKGTFSMAKKGTAATAAKTTKPEAGTKVSTEKTNTGTSSDITSQGKKDGEDGDGAGGSGDPTPTPPQPQPSNRMVNPNMVRLRALRHLHEGDQVLKPGDEFETTEARAVSIPDDLAEVL